MPRHRVVVTSYRSPPLLVLLFQHNGKPVHPSWLLRIKSHFYRAARKSCERSHRGCYNDAEKRVAEERCSGTLRALSFSRRWPLSAIISGTAISFGSTGRKNRPPTSINLNFIANYATRRRVNSARRRGEVRAVR